MTAPNTSHWPIYQVGENVVIPFTVQVEGGARFEAKPYRSFPLGVGMSEALREIFRSHNTRHIRSFQKADVPTDRPAFLKLLGVRSEHDLQALGRLWMVSEQGGRFEIEKWKSGASRGFERDTDAVFEQGMAMDAAAQAVADALNTNP